MMTMRDFFMHERIRRAFPLLRRKLALADAYEQLAAAPWGQIIIRDLVREGGVLAVADDPADSRFYDGKRALALHVLERLRWSATELQQLGHAVTYEQLIDREYELNTEQHEETA